VLLSFKTHSLASADPAPAPPAVSAAASPAAGSGMGSGTAGSEPKASAGAARTVDGAESGQIDGAAIPRLTSEPLAAQSAQIDAVSGASCPSSGYNKSLQSALDQTGR
jgi:hypothetical protein